MKNSTMKSVLVALISLALAGTCFPLLGDEVYAQGQDNGSESYYALPGDGEGGFVSTDDAMTKDEVNAVIKGQQQTNAPKANTNDAIKTEDNGVAAKAAIENEQIGRIEEESSPISGQALFEDREKAGDFKAMGDDYGYDDTTYQEVECEGTRTYNPQTGIVTINDVRILTQGVYLTAIYVDDDEVTYDAAGKYVDINEATEIDSLTIDMKDYDIGFHTIWLVTGDNDPDIIYEDLVFDYIPTQIYARPSVYLSDLYSGYDYFNYRNSNYSSYYDGVYFNYVRAGGGWSAGYGLVGYNQLRGINGLAAACTYSVRAYYIKNTQYRSPLESQTETYTFKGSDTGAYSGPVSFRTGYAVTPVKSIKAKKVKQWCKKVKYLKLSKKVYYRKGYAGWGYYRKILGKKTKKYWYTKVRVTVNMQYVPGVAGIYIGSKAVYGNMNKYTADFTLAGKKSGKKISVSVYSFMDPTYGGLSGGFVKKVKVKKK